MPLDMIVRLAIFLLVLASMLLWQTLKPRRAASPHTPQRWLNHLSLSVINSLVAKLVLPMGLSGLAVLFESQQWGLLRQLEWPFMAELLISLIALDLIIYWQHRLFHRIPWLWSLHRVHHSDIDFDCTTALRFHPFEILLSLLIKAAAVLILGISAEAILIFEILLNALALFNHANIYLPASADKYLRKFIITPDMHRVHHSTELTESNSNFGFNLSCWDYLFSSYCHNSKAGQMQMQFGLKGCEYEQQKNLGQLLKQPLSHFSGREYD